MDLLAKRYASPYLILDDFIRLQQLFEFTTTILQMVYDEKVHEARWQYYLHKVYDMSFEDYVQYCENKQPAEQPMTHKEISETIEESRKMLEGFVPE